MPETSHTSRRAPHMERYVEVSQFRRGFPWKVRLKVGHQSFDIGDGHDTQEEAEWMRDMLCIALDAIVDEEGRPVISMRKLSNLFFGRRSS